MDNPTIILWIPLIIIALLSIHKMIKKQNRSRKPWIRIEEIEEDE